MKRYRCPKCKTIAEIDFDRKIKKFTLPKGATAGLVWRFPIHRDCELNKSLDEIDVSKLERLG